jgi:hypothetical protein
VVSIAVSPSALVLQPAGALQTHQLAVTAHYSDGTSGDATSGATFASSDTAVVTVSTAGLVTAHSLTVVGTPARITVTASAKTFDVPVNVRPVPLDLFVDDYGSGLSFAPFGGSTSVVTVDTAEHHSGTASLRLDIPTSNYTGGAVVAATAQDVSAFNAITFWAKTDNAAVGSLDKVGYGNDTASNAHQGEWMGQQFTGTWTQFVLPLGGHSKLTAEKGLFHFARGGQAGGFHVWVDDVRYEFLEAAALGTASPAIATETVNLNPGGAGYDVNGASVAVTVPGNPSSPTVVVLSRDLLDWTSSDHTIAPVDVHGHVTPLALGSVAITAKLDGADAAGVTTVDVVLPPVPAALPPVPTIALADVISLYSSVTGGYDGTAADRSANVDTWLSCWSGGAGGDPMSPAIAVSGNTAAPRKYVLGAGATSYIGIETMGKTGAGPGNCDVPGTVLVGNHELDVSALDHFHIDVWSPDIKTTSNFQVQLVDAGATGQMLVGEKTFGIATLTSASTPPLAQSTWLSYDLPFSAFPGLANFKHIAQLILQAPDGATIFVDNLYFYKAPAAAGPAAPPAAPTALAANVMSLFSSSYTGGTSGGDYSGRVDAYHADCFTGPPGNVSLVDFAIPSAHSVKEYTYGGTGFAVIETIGNSGGTATPPDACFGGTQTGANLIDVSAMTKLHVDVWSPVARTNYQVHLINADGGSISGPGQIAGHTPGTQYNTGALALAPSAWTSFDLDLAADLGVPAAGVTKLGLTKLFTADAGVYYVDNLYFYRLPPLQTITFDDAAVTYTLTGFGGAEDSAVVANPSATGIDTSAKVARVNRSATAADWAGTTVASSAGTVVPFTATKRTLTAKVYSPAAGVPVLLKVEDHTTAGAVFVQKVATTTVANAWETLTFDMGTPTLGSIDAHHTYDMISIFFDFGVTGATAGALTFYFDDIAFVP